MRKIGILPLKNNRLILCRHAVQVDEVGEDLSDKEDVTRLLHCYETVHFEWRQVVGCLDEVNASLTI